MGFRFRKSISLGKGFRINLSKSGIGYSFGTKGIRFSRSPNGKSRSTVSVPGTGISYVSEHSGVSSGKCSSGAKASSSKNAPSNPPSNHNPWIMFFVCLFFGFFGVHKFLEKQTGKGFLYLFTCGLFGFGWLIDSSVYLFKAIKYSLQSSPTSTAFADPTAHAEQASAVNSLHSKDHAISDSVSVSENTDTVTTSVGLIKKVFLWIAIAFVALFSLAALVSGGVFSFLCSALIIGLILPIEPWQNLLQKHIKGKFKTVALILLPIIFFIGFPTSDNLPSSTPTLPPVASTAATTAPTGNATETTMPPDTEATATTTVPATEHTTPATETVHVHEFGDATCVSPKTCKTCGESEGTATGHSWKNATCTSPKTCSVCGVTEGQPIDHSWIAATCTTPKTCSVCSKTEGGLGAHEYSGGNCLVCNTKDPNHQDEIMVWIPANGQGKYHSKSSCSGMKNPIQITKSEAIARGYQPCGRCY